MTKINLVLADSEAEQETVSPTSTDPVAEATVVTPETGEFTTINSGASQNIALVSATILAILATIAIIICKVRKHRKTGFIASLLVIAVALIGVTNLSNQSFADEVDTSDNLSIEAPAEITLNCESDKSVFITGKATVAANDSTNYGYKLYALAGNGLDFTSETGKTITSISEAGKLEANTYGFTTTPNATAEDAVWHPLGSVAEIVADYTTATAANNTTDIYFGILTDDTMPAGTYELGVNFYATITPLTIDSLTYMQDFKALSEEERATVISSMTVREDNEGPFYTLKDKRDGKEYRIGRLSNDYLFMLDNLKLDPTDANGNARVLTSELSDITPNENYVSFTMPTEEWVSADQNYVSKANMAIFNDEYYYNWYAANANPYVGENPKKNSPEGFDNVLGSICPAGWTMPFYGYVLNDDTDADIKLETLWSNGANPANFYITNYVVNGEVQTTNKSYAWGKDLREGNTSVFKLMMSVEDATGVIKTALSSMASGYAVRCATH